MKLFSKLFKKNCVQHTVDYSSEATRLRVVWLAHKRVRSSNIVRQYLKEPPMALNMYDNEDLSTKEQCLYWAKNHFNQIRINESMIQTLRLIPDTSSMSVFDLANMCGYNNDQFK